jgi:metal-sulfur cluster biosynthetic enzyme
MKRLSLLLFALFLPTLFVMAQTPIVTTSSREGFVLYRCTPTDGAQAVTLSAYLASGNGGNLLPDIENVALEAVGLDGVPSLEASTTETRQPVRIVVVLDTTSTMPLLNVINALSTQFFPQLEFNDQVALITFTQTVSSPTPFFTDKNRLVNEYMLSLRTGGGSNRMYDAILAGVNTLGADDDTRNIVLLITDSSRREVGQAELNDIISIANTNKTQIYSVGIVTEDTPDRTELQTISERTNAFSWFYNDGQEAKSTTTLDQSLVAIMNQLVAIFDQEVAFNVDLSAFDLGDIRDITLKTDLTLNTGTILTDTIVCPAPQAVAATATQPASTTVPNVITLSSDIGPITTTEAVDITVTVQTGLPESEQLVIFLQNGEVIQSSKSLTYTFNTATLPPGTYSIAAQLRNLDNIVFATTDNAVTINAQQVISLNVLEGALDRLDAPLRLEALTNPTLPLPDVRFSIATSSDPTTRYPLGVGVAPVQSGSAQLVVPNLRAEILRLFPNITDGETLTIGAQIPSSQSNTPPLAQSEPLSVVYTVPPPPPVDTQLVSIGVLTLALFLLNVVAFFRVRRARVRRMIAKPDGYDLPNRLMAVTVYRDALKHTVTLTKKTLTVGRGGNNDINIGDDNKVSRQHGVIMWRKDDWYYTNRKPDVQVRIGGRRVRGFKLVKLESVTEIEMGDARLFFHSNSQQDITELTRTNL